jgi:hypothetical protein
MEGSCEYILNKQSWTADKAGPPGWGLGEVLTVPHRNNWPCYEKDTIATGLD